MSFGDLEVSLKGEKDIKNINLSIYVGDFFPILKFVENHMLKNLLELLKGI